MKRTFQSFILVVSLLLLIVAVILESLLAETEVEGFILIGIILN